MAAIGQYVLSVVCVSVLCGILQMLIPGVNSLIKLVMGIIIVVAAIGPIVQGGPVSVDFFLENITADGQWAVREGEQAASQTGSAFIRERTQTYISNKAAELGVQIQAEVKLDEEKQQVPCEVTIRGMVSPYVKKQLADYLHCELGISEENQIWVS